MIGAYHSFSVLNFIIISCAIAILIALLNYFICIKKCKKELKQKTIIIISITLIFNIILKILLLCDDQGPGLDYWHMNELDIILKYIIIFMPFVIQTLILIKLIMDIIKSKKEGGKN